MMGTKSRSLGADRRLVVLTGASGSGKTTLARRCSTLHPLTISVHHFDAISVPSTREMIAQFGSMAEWQRRKTLEWFERLARTDAPRVLFEGQSRIAFINAALSAARISGAKVLLIDCADDIRTHRLRTVRKQPELATETMLEWAEYLRREAREFGCEILDTTTTPVDVAVAKIVRAFGPSRI